MPTPRAWACASLLAVPGHTFSKPVCIARRFISRSETSVPGLWSMHRIRQLVTRRRREGIDPRQEKADQHSAQLAAKEIASATAVRESITLGGAWPEYVRERIPQWTEHHIAAHRKLIQIGGEPRKCSPKLTEPSPLASLAAIRLVDLNMERLEAWARVESLARPSSARLPMRLLKACLNWCSCASNLFDRRYQQCCQQHQGPRRLVSRN